MQFNGFKRILTKNGHFLDTSFPSINRYNTTKYYFKITEWKTLQISNVKS